MRILQPVRLRLIVQNLFVSCQNLMTPPFPIEENSKTKDEIRLKYRYLDLRRPDLQRNLMMKKQGYDADSYSSWQKKDSLRLKHRCLVRATPEGARDYLVPSQYPSG